MANQTAVEWVEYELYKLTSAVITAEITQEQYHKQRVGLWEKAKQMEKEQTIDFAGKVLNKAECSFTGIVRLEESIEDIFVEIFNNINDGK
jgi:hypothetical protein